MASSWIDGRTAWETGSEAGVLSQVGWLLREELDEKRVNVAVVAFRGVVTARGRCTSTLSARSIDCPLGKCTSRRQIDIGSGRCC